MRLRALFDARRPSSGVPNEPEIRIAATAASEGSPPRSSAIRPAQ